MRCYINATLIFPDRLVPDGAVHTEGDRISFAGPAREAPAATGERVDLQGNYLAPGFIDIHLHGGDGADFMDGTEEAFRTICKAHARHGTTSLLPTSCVALKPQILRFLELCREFKDRSQFSPSRRAGTEAHRGATCEEPPRSGGLLYGTPREATCEEPPRSGGLLYGSRVLGAHFYGPYFFPAAKGCHPAVGLCAPGQADYADYLEYADCITTATVAPELPGAEAFVRDCRKRGIHCNAGHSHCTFAEVEASIGWGVRHIDHVFCAMSDRTRLRQSQPFPMRGGMLEATLYFDELTTEIIADGKHLQGELLRIAYKAKGPDRLALVTDTSRAMDMPDGEYSFGPPGVETPFRKENGVGVTLDGKALASSVVGLDHCVRTFHHATGVPLAEVVRMATLTPARIIGMEKDLGSLAAGKLADLVELDGDLRVKQVWIGGVKQ